MVPRWLILSYPIHQRERGIDKADLSMLPTRRRPILLNHLRPLLLLGSLKLLAVVRPSLMVHRRKISRNEELKILFVWSYIDSSCVYNRKYFPWFFGVDDDSKGMDSSLRLQGLATWVDVCFYRPFSLRLADVFKINSRGAVSLLLVGRMSNAEKSQLELLIIWVIR